MADPNNIDDALKVAGGGGAGAFVAALVAFFARAGTASRLDAMAAQIAELNAKLTILVAASERRDDEHDRLDAEKRLAALEAHVAQIQRTLDSMVTS